MAVAYLSGAALLVVWIVLAFVVAIPTGWVHLFLAAGSVMIARGIILSPPAGNAERIEDKGGAGGGRQADRGGQRRAGADKQ